MIEIGLAATSGATQVYRVLHHPPSWGMPVATYILKHGMEWVVIDSGWPGPHGQADWQAVAAQLDLRWQNLRRVVITHGHPDHIGQAQTLADLSWLPVTVHGDVVEDLAYYGPKGPWSAGGKQRFLKLAAAEDLGSVRDPFATAIKVPRSVRPFVPGETVELGDCVLNTLLTPGHSAGHVCLIDSKRQFALTADMLLPNYFTNIVSTALEPVSQLQLYLASLRTIEETEVELMLPGHGEPMRKAEYRHRVAEVRQYFERQVDDVRAVLGEGEATLMQLASRLSFQGKPYASLSPINRVTMLGETLAYVQYLVAERGARAAMDDRTMELRCGRA
jgi:glyoxylase-like metal-dependent hydrolase (beta-lactamase superfamily II)